LKIISSILIILTPVIIIGVILIGLGIGIGYLLSALLPGVDIGTGLVAGAIFSVGIAWLFLQLILVFLLPEEDEEEGEFDEPIILTTSRFLQRRMTSERRGRGRRK